MIGLHYVAFVFQDSVPDPKPNCPAEEFKPLDTASQTAEIQHAGVWVRKSGDWLDSSKWGRKSGV